LLGGPIEILEAGVVFGQYCVYGVGPWVVLAVLGLGSWPGDRVPTTSDQGPTTRIAKKEIHTA